jgi:hypothetical protein
MAKHKAAHRSSAEHLLVADRLKIRGIVKEAAHGPSLTDPITTSFGGDSQMNNGTPGRRGSQHDQLATRWTEQQRTSIPLPEDEIIYLHLPSRTIPGSTYIFPLALCPSLLPGRKQ